MVFASACFTFSRIGIVIFTNKTHWITLPEKLLKHFQWIVGNDHKSMQGFGKSHNANELLSMQRNYPPRSITRIKQQPTKARDC